MMKVLLYDYYKLEEIHSRKLRIWKACHIALYVLVAIFGIANFTFLEYTKQFVNGHCVFYPRQLEFRLIERETVSDGTKHVVIVVPVIANRTLEKLENNTKPSIPDIADSEDGGRSKNRSKREASEPEPSSYEVTVEVDNVTVLLENRSHHLVLDPRRSLFQRDTACQFAEFMPLLSSVCALVWATLFTMCPGGGRQTTGLQQPWRILTPALLCALALAVATGIGFSSTNGGLQDFCAQLQPYSHTTKCLGVDAFLSNSTGGFWSFSSQATATRAAGAGVWAGWVCVAALLLARCLTAPDFQLQRTGVYLRDPGQKIIPHLKLARSSARSVFRSATRSPSGASDSPTPDSGEPTVSSQEMTSAAVEPPVTSSTEDKENEAMEMTENTSIYSSPTTSLIDISREDSHHV